MKKIIFIFCFLLLTAQSQAVILQDSMPIFAVIEGQETAIDANLTVHLISGSGNVFTSVAPYVGSSTQESQKTVVSFLSLVLPEAKNYDYLFEIRGNASDVDGPSAGAAMALLSYSMLKNKKLPDIVAMTGTVSKEGYVGKVGGIFYKAKRAAQLGIKLFLIPIGESKQTTVIDGKVQTIYLPDYAKEKWNMLVVEVKSIGEAYKLAFSDINEIETEEQKEEEKFTLPKDSQFTDSDFQELAISYLKDANSTIQDVYNRINNQTNISYNDLSLISSRLKTAEDFLIKANEAYEKKYFYSSSSLSLISIIYSSYAQEIAKDTKILDPNSNLFDVKIITLETDYQKFENTIKNNFNSSCLPYSLGSLQRYSWGKKLLQNLKEQETTIIVDIYGQTVDTTVYSRLYDYIESKERLKIANKLYEFSLRCQKTFSEQPSLTNEIKTYSDRLQTLFEQSNNKESIIKKIETSYILQNQGYDSAALLEIGEAIAEAEASLLDNDLEQTKKLAEKNLTKNPVSKWGNIYLTHSDYYYQQGLFYEKVSDLSSAKQSYETSILFSKYSEIYDELYSIIEKKPFKEKEESLIDIEIPFRELAIIFSLFAFLILIVIILTVKPKIIDNNTIEDNQIELRKKYSEGKIDEKTYLSQAKHIEERKQELLEQQKKKSLLSAEKIFLQEEISSLNHLVNRLENLDKKGKSNFLKGEIFKHKKKLERYKQRLKSL